MRREASARPMRSRLGQRLRQRPTQLGFAGLRAELVESADARRRVIAGAAFRSAAAGSTRMTAVEAQFYWMSAKVPSDQFLLCSNDPPTSPHQHRPQTAIITAG
jgi:hypothetical protein